MLSQWILSEQTQVAYPVITDRNLGIIPAPENKILFAMPCAILFFFIHLLTHVAVHAHLGATIKCPKLQNFVFLLLGTGNTVTQGVTVTHGDTGGHIG